MGSKRQQNRPLRIQWSAGGDRLDRSIAAASPRTASAPTVATPPGTAPAPPEPAPTAAPAAIFPRLGLINGQGPAFDLLTVERLNSRLGFRVAAHFDEAKSLGSAGVTVHDHLRRLHGAMRLE